MHNALLFNRRLWSIFMSAAPDQRESAVVGSSSEHRQYRRVRDEADRRNADESGSGEIEVADRHQLQSGCGPVRPRLKGDGAATWLTFSASCRPITRRLEPTIPSKTPYVPVDPTLYQGDWTGKYADNKTFKISISNVTGFRAKVQYQSGGTNKYAGRPDQGQRVPDRRHEIQADQDRDRGNQERDHRSLDRLDNARHRLRQAEPLNRRP